MARSTRHDYVQVVSVRPPESMNMRWWYMWHMGGNELGTLFWFVTSGPVGQGRGIYSEMAPPFANGFPEMRR